MKYCRNCNERIDDNDRFCSFCGCDQYETKNTDEYSYEPKQEIHNNNYSSNYKQTRTIDEGSSFGGFLLGLLLGLIGIIVAACIKKPKTKKGAWIGFVVSIILSIVGTCINN